MKIFGIEFAPLNTPVNRRLQTLAVAINIFILLFGEIIASVLTTYLILFTHLRWFVISYLIWMWTDRHAGEKGGRRLACLRNWILWKYFKEYFPLKLEKVPEVELDPQRNYLFCVFPHGMLCTGVHHAFCTNFSEFGELFPHHTAHSLTLALHLNTPFSREFLLSLGVCSSSSASINYLLGSPEGAKVAVLVVGGASEAFYSRPGKYKIVLRNRRGFVKLALKNGAPLVPVISFGETDLYDQLDSPEGFPFRKFQIAIKNWTGIAPIVLMGRGIFQYSFGILPMRKPVTTLVGRPIEVEKVADPTNEQVEALHEKFVKELTDFFEEYKHVYIKDSENVKLEIV